MHEDLSYFSNRQRLKPIDELNSNDIALLFEKSKFVKLDPRSIFSQQDNILYYLMEGEVSVLSGGFVVEQFNHTDQRALQPLFSQMLEADSALVTSHGAVLELDREFFEALYSQHQAASVQTTEISLRHQESELYQQLVIAFQQNRLQLPAMPEAAFKIRQAINVEGVGSTEIIQIVQTEPVLSARIIKVANSPLYGTWRDIKTVRDAVRRLGLETTRNLSLSLSLKQLFNASTSLIKQQIKLMYEESVNVSALAYVITQYRAKHLDPEQALLAGLVQNIGVIPILKHIDENPKLLSQLPALDKSIKQLRIPISTLLLNQWNFGDEFIHVVEQADNRQRDSADEIDYADVVIAAKLLYTERVGINNNAFDFKSLAIVNKLNLMEVDANGEYFFEGAKNEIDEMNKLLRL